MEKLVLDRDRFVELKNNTSQMNDKLEKAFQLGKEFLAMLQTTDQWEGKSKEEFQSYLHLVLQYHGQLIGEKMPAIGKVKTAKVNGNTCETALETLQEHNRNMDQFTGNCKSYQELERI
ncbi:hypothetical protein R2R35_22790 [Anaerocolumna sp. AGMB13020]|uniref:hypothetical protein n=1 Tax=Anaerocolumna sp. AGMB13020 TaxID=3081750 RepID=UPI002955CA8D|nr:hypothetical protein [Anaerocolumna sp. AGMB13020]WOO36585.1 hypothetical protein R2R35_22790 [Anaerocolumna sp. AGMB13020]